MDRHAVAAIFAEIAAILEITGANPFKVRAYENAARAVDGLADFAERFAKGTLTDIRGIGKNLADHIVELMTTGRLQEYETLRQSIPSGLLEILQIPGVGPKKVKVLWEKLGVKDIGALELCCRAHRIAGLAGMGEKTEEKILQGIQYVRAQRGQHLFHVAWAAATQILEALERHPSVTRIAITGSLRRRKEIVKDIDLVASARHAEQLMDAFCALPMVARVAARGETKSTIVLVSGINCDLRVVTDAEFSFALHHFTGSKEHNVAMRGRAGGMGMKMNEYGLFKISKAGEKLIVCKDEAAIFAALGLAYIPPELRENMGEIDAAAAGKLPRLVEAGDLQGVFHCHTTYSDGQATLDEMVAAAMKMGLKYIGIADHSQSASYAGGLKPAAIRAQHREIATIQKRYPRIRIFKGIESDILADGALDYPENILRTFDFVVASIHSRMNLTSDEMTKRICTAIANPYTTILAHPTGRLLLARDGYPMAMPTVLETAATHDVVVETNSNPHRLDLDWRHGPYAHSKGVKTMINPDAHSVVGLGDVRYGVGVARKGWWTKEDVVNTWDVEQVEQWLSEITQHLQ